MAELRSLLTDARRTIQIGFSQHRDSTRGGMLGLWECSRTLSGIAASEAGLAVRCAKLWALDAGAPKRAALRLDIPPPCRMAAFDLSSPSKPASHIGPCRGVGMDCGARCWSFPLA